MDLLVEAKPVEVKWIFKTKLNEKGDIENIRLDWWKMDNVNNSKSILLEFFLPLLALIQ